MTETELIELDRLQRAGGVYGATNEARHRFIDALDAAGGPEALLDALLRTRAVLEDVLAAGEACADTIHDLVEDEEVDNATWEKTLTRRREAWGRAAAVARQHL